MARWLPGLAAASLLSACAPGTAQQATGSDVPHQERTAYVVIPSTSTDQGWDVLDALDAELSPADRQRIRHRGLVSGTGTAVMVAFDGECAADRAFVDAVAKVAQARAVAGSECRTSIEAP